MCYFWKKVTEEHNPSWCAQVLWAHQRTL